MAVTNFYVAQGTLIGERTDSGTRTNFGVDALGSVVSTIQGNSVQSTHRYKPYGAVLSSSGVEPATAFRWVGTLGYRETDCEFAEEYVRARHYSTATGRWTSVDPLWPKESAYAYVRSNPSTFVDPSGLYQLRYFPNWKCGKKTYDVIDVAFDAGDATAVATGNIKGVIAAAGAVAACKKCFSHKGKTLVINGSLFSVGGPLGKLKNCNGQTTNGIGSDEPARGASMVSLQKGYMYLRKIWVKGKCNPEAASDNKSGTTRNIAGVTASGQMYGVTIVKTPMSSEEMCNCFPDDIRASGKLTYYALDGGSSTQIWEQKTDKGTVDLIWRKTPRRPEVNNWVWVREP